MGYCTIAEIKARETVSGVTDAQYQSSLDWAEAVLDRLTNDHFESTDLTIYVSGSGSWRQNLYPGTFLKCLSISSIVDVPSGGEITSAEFQIQGHFLVLLEEYTVRAGAVNSVWPAGIYNIRVKGSFGWSSVPVEIRDACILLALNKVKKLSGSAIGGGVKSERIGDYSYTKSVSAGEKAITGIVEVDEVIDMYKNQFMAMEVV